MKRYIVWIAALCLIACGEAVDEQQPDPDSSGGANSANGGSVDAGNASNADPGNQASNNASAANNMSTGNSETGPANSGPGPNNITELPPFDGTSPFEGAPAPTRVLPEVLNSHVEWFSWDPNLQTLYFAVALGGRGSVPKVDDAYLAENPDAVQRHPYRMWRYQEFADGPVAEEFMHLPAEPNGRGETHWCKWARTNAEFWCHHNLKKASEAVIRVTEGNGLDTPLTYDSWGLSYWDPATMDEHGALHDGMVDLVEATSGQIYWTVKIGIGGSNRSYLVRAVPPLDEPPLLLAKSTEEMNELHGVALSPDERTLYFTTGSYSSGGDQLGKIWSANVQSDGSIDAPQIFADSVYRPRGLTADEHGFVYVASGLEVRVFDDLGRDVDTLQVVTDHPEQESLESARSKYALLSVEFGGADGNILYMGLGFDRKGTENIDNPTTFTQGGLYRMPLSVRAPWAAR